MTIYYIDPEGGNDANNGLSFANRWRTFKNTGSTPPVVGDEYRVMASRPEQNLGTAAWVSGQDYITYTTPPFAVIADGGTNMTPTTNVNITADFTASPVYGVGGNFIRCTTSGKSGKIAHLNLGGAMDLSAYTHLSLLLRSDNDTYPLLDNITLNLCSDTSGDTVVLALPLAATYRSSALSQLLTNGGAALPSGINSISLTLTTATPNTNRSIHFLGLIACQGPDHASHISHLSLLSKHTTADPEWLAVKAFRTGGKVYVGGKLGTTGELEWKGTSESVATWARLPTRAKFNGTNEAAFDGVRSSVKISGGWNRTDMSTQPDVTWASGEFRSISGSPTGQPGFMKMSNVINNNAAPAEFSKIGLAHYFYRPLDYSTMPFITQLEGLVSCLKGIAVPWGASQTDVGDVTHGAGPIDPTAGVLQGDAALIKGRKIMGCYTLYFPPTGLSNRRIAFKYIENSAFGVSVSAGVTKISNTEFRRNTGDGEALNDACLWLSHCTFPLSGGFPNPSFVKDSPGASIRLDAVNGQAWDNRVYGTHEIRVVTDTVRTAGKRSVRLAAGSSVGKLAVERVALIPVRAGETVKVSGYVKASTTGNKASLSVLEGSFPGIPHTKATGLRLAGQWSRVVLELNPTVDGLIPIHLECEGSSNSYWATEVGVDTTGVPADPEPVMTLIQSVTFVGVDDFYWESDPAVVAGDAFAAEMIGPPGGPVVNLPGGTITPGDDLIRGVLWADFGGVGFHSPWIQLITEPIAEEDGIGWKMVVKDSGGTVLAETLDPQVLTYMSDHGEISFYPTELHIVAGTTYIIELHRLI